ncbi:MAG: 2Fe-2S iron-sulfur cluster binding domain-containing protein [Cyanobacteria bacterium HKST-UBA06]|nr:2Fe-2S iron-sulfur cluster binding domain-containing protein [Cyanobacteria bacterium HKST-UBA05]MCA9799353.1 2Fe-2S iron-sulfur cluster binding domain-containing protein [Cyanobacteria bacterium HKST-UBA04]MCA9806504.1 2Fe-2S iron-sulfur cluster binding domain-containing protein [Cyanobacteria bacterium HKST-UBA06]MCA9841326.1 2Fe-2S iron-sulfur cluster binding domain-containing protein [Cyanobacteria bacterium HKST-UBA03]
MYQVTFQPSGKTIDIDGETTLREAAHRAGVDVHDRCGGNGSCCNCVVTVLEGAPNICEKTIVEEAVFYMDKDDRLSCQCRIHGDVVLRVD